jgi:hypothetical protein
VIDAIHSGSSRTLSFVFGPTTALIAALGMQGSTIRQSERLSGSNLVITPAREASSNVFSIISTVSLDMQLAVGLTNVFTAISSNQRELEPTAKRILYSRMRELYLR